MEKYEKWMQGYGNGCIKKLLIRDTGIRQWRYNWSFSQEYRDKTMDIPLNFLQDKTMELLFTF